MTLIKRGKIWHYHFQSDGIRYHGSCRTGNRVAAQQAESAMRRAVQSGALPQKANKTITLHETFNIYMEWATGAKRSAETDRCRLQHILDFHGAGARLYAVSRNAAWPDHYRAARIAAGISGATVNRELAAARGAFNKAISWGLCDRNPVAGHHLDARAETQRCEYLTPDAARRLLDACADPLFRTLVLAALVTGCRRGELFAANVGDYDPARGLLRIHKHNTKNGRERYVSLPASVFVAPCGIPAASSGPVALFPNRSGGRRLNVRTPWATAMRRSGLAAERAAAGRPPLRFHDLRHTFASWLAEATGDLYLVEKALGHQSGDMTRRYAHLTETRVSDAVGTMLGELTSTKTRNNDSSGDKQQNADQKYPHEIKDISPAPIAQVDRALDS